MVSALHFVLLVFLPSIRTMSTTTASQISYLPVDCPKAQEMTFGVVN